MKKIHKDRYRQLGLRVAYYRKMAGYTQEELAEIIGKSPAFIGHVEAPNVEKAISLDTLFDITDALNIQPHKLLIFD